MHRILTTVAATTLMALCGTAADAAKLVYPDTLHGMLTLDTLDRGGGRIEGVIENHGQRPVEDVEVAVRYGWVWDHEPAPEAIDDSPGWAEYVTIDRRLAPGERATFVYTPDRPLPRRDDGRFVRRAEIVGATVF